MEHRSSGPPSRGRACRYVPIATGRAQIFGCRLGGLDGGVGSERAQIYTSHTIIAVIEHVQIINKRHFMTDSRPRLGPPDNRIVTVSPPEASQPLSSGVVAFINPATEDAMASPRSVVAHPPHYPLTILYKSTANLEQSHLPFTTFCYRTAGRPCR